MHGPVLPDARLRAEARQLYGADPTGYEAGRPDYPERVYELLTTRCGLGPSSTVLEIGPGTGRVTRRLTALGAHVVAIEPDQAMAAHLRASTDPSSVEVLGESFEDASIAEDRFDLAVAAMSFQWVDQHVGLPKLGRVIRPGGWVALWWTLFGDPARPDPFLEATRELIEPRGSPTGSDDRVPFEVDAEGWRDALSGRAGLVDVESERIPWTARLDPERLRALYGTMIAIRRRPPSEQRRLLDRLVSIAWSDFGGLVERPFVTAINMGRRASSN
jgi:SAM-dependent methyltransferase